MIEIKLKKDVFEHICDVLESDCVCPGFFKLKEDEECKDCAECWKQALLKGDIDD
ncbi:hypothetical protein CB452P1_000062 [Clostridium phage CB452P1]|nr:hypothetical protein CB452P1_000062 [Clostridium phage CB452P1]